MNLTTADKLFVWLSQCFECSPKQAMDLVEANDGIEQLHKNVSLGKIVSNRELSKDKYALLTNNSPIPLIEDYIELLNRNGVFPLTIANDLYPNLLREIYDPPLVLYCRGNYESLNESFLFSVIGSRHCTEYGEQMTKYFSSQLAQGGMTVVSGLAYGCDAYASRAALDSANSALPTVAVLGQGVCVRKNDSTAKLMDEIVQRGLVISEMLPFSKATRYSYPMRNRIISGMSNGLLVVEAGSKSGTMITANAAVDQNRMVFAVPGRLTDMMSTGTNNLLQMGMAQPVYGPEDIFEYYRMNFHGVSLKENIEDAEKMRQKMTTEQKLVYDLLIHGEKSFDSLCELSGWSVEKLNLCLTEMEFSGLIKQLPGRVYSV